MSSKTTRRNSFGEIKSQKDFIFIFCYYFGVLSMNFLSRHPKCFDKFIVDIDLSHFDMSCVILSSFSQIWNCVVFQNFKYFLRNVRVILSYKTARI